MAAAPAAAQLDVTLKSYLQLIGDANAAIEKKLKAAQELSENFESVVSSVQYNSQISPELVRVFIKVLEEGEPQFLSEPAAQQLRKLLLEILHRIPTTNDQFKVHVKPILSLAFKLVEIENEENALICVRLLMDLHRNNRPHLSPEAPRFLGFVKRLYRELPNHVSKIFEPRPTYKVKDLCEVPIDAWINDIYFTTQIVTEKRTDNQPVTYNIIPKATLSLKVMAELPIIVVLMYQLYKHSIQQDVEEFMPLIMNTLSLQPSKEQRLLPSNKEKFVDFIAAQVKSLSFLAYVLRPCLNTITAHAPALVSGIVGLLTLCPPEVAHLRKDLLIATRHILGTELRTRFLNHIARLFDEDILIGTGWTAQETMKALAYSTLADLVHHVRLNLPLTELALAVDLFAKNIHDDTLMSSIQTMSCKLLLNLVENIKGKSDQENGNGRELLMYILEIYVLKFKSIAENQLPVLLAKCKPHNPDSKSGDKTDTQTSADDKAGSKGSLESVTEPADKDDKTANFSVTDCRSLVKTLVCGTKTITWAVVSCKSPNTDQTMITSKQFHPKEILVYMRLVKYALKALDIYTIAVSSTGQPFVRPAYMANVKTKEEKEVLEHFAGVYTLMNPVSFREIFIVTINNVVESIYNNYALQIVANSFLANVSTSPTFATILVEYLLARLEEMGSSSTERSNLYLKLFKLVFGSVSLFAAENEQMLKPHLHTIVNRSMELAMTAKEPYNYFLLLRALFRSIGGGSHDLLYQEFLPLLPDLLQGLNSLQSGLHKQHMKDLFVELCLTVPVRLSSLLPYLPMLMDPLVSALNGSQTLISQGLRTLELCVDNLQPDFLYDHIQPVRADLMQALWRCLRNSNDPIAHVAFRVLGKFGGGNRKMLREPQGLVYNQRPTAGPSVIVHFQDCKTAIHLPIEKSVECALQTLKTSSTDIFYRKHAWNLVKCFLVSAVNLDDDKVTLTHLLLHHNFQDGPIQSLNHHSLYECSDLHVRSVMQKALSAMFVAASIKELQSGVVPFMTSLVRHFTMALVAQQAGPFMLGDKFSKLQGTDAYVLIDALATVMGDEEKELCKPAHIALVLILETSTAIMGARERACQLPLFVYMAEKMCALCYERAWYSKLGGCTAIKFMFERMSKKWILQHQFVFLKALVFIMMDLTSEVSSGALDMAKCNFEQMLKVCAAEVDSSDTELVEVQNKSFYDVAHELVRQVTSPNTLVREQAMHGLKILAEARKTTVTEVMEPHRDVLQDMVPPKKHLLRHQPANAQIGIMDANTFCTMLEPKLFSIDLEVPEHKIFFTELVTLCEAEDTTLQKLPCYKSVKNLAPLRKSALRALSACHYLVNMREKIFNVLYKELNSTNSELQKVAHECMKKFIGGFQMEMEQIHSAMRTLLNMLGDYRNLTLNVIHRLTSLTQLFPNTFNEKLCDQLLTLLRKKLEVAVTSQAHRQNRGAGSVQSNGMVIPLEVKTCAAIINIYHLIPAATTKILEPLTSITMKGEKSLCTERGSPFQEPLFKFLLRFPTEAVDLFLSDAYLADPHTVRVFLAQFKSAENGAKFREKLVEKTSKIIELLQTQIVTGASIGSSLVDARDESQYIGVQLVHIITKHDNSYIKTNSAVLKVLMKLWTSDVFHDKHRKLVSVLRQARESCALLPYQEPKLIIKCLLAYFKQDNSDIELLFRMLRCFSSHLLPQYQFFRNFLHETVAKTYSIDWKRSAFFKFAEIFHDTKFTQEMIAKMLQLILIPCFQNAFDSGHGKELIGGPAAPDQDNPDNIISVFINKVIDPDNPFATSDNVRILLLQFSSMLVEHASPHIHDANNKRQGNKLRRLMTFAWPCLLSKNCVDPATKYNGHLLLSHIIAKFAIHKRIVLQVFHSLLKAHAVEARAVVRQALDILTPAMPGRMEDGNIMLIHWTKKIILEEGHTIAQLVHILQLIVRHNKVYSPVRHQLVQHMVTSMQRLAFTQTPNFEQKRLTVDIAEVIVKWEIGRVKEESNTVVKEEPQVPVTTSATASSATTSSATTSSATTPTSSSATSPGKAAVDVNKPIEKHFCDAVINFLLRIACQVNESNGTGGSPGELLSRRSVNIIKTALKSESWPMADLKLNGFEKLFMSVDTSQPNYSNICTALELLTFLLTILKKETILSSLKPLQKGIAACMNCTNSKVIRSVHGLLSKLMSIFPTEPVSSNVASKHDELEVLYACVSKVVYEGLSSYEKSTTGTHPLLFGTLMILKATCSHNQGYIDRLITSFMRVLQRMTKEHLAPTNQESIPIASDLLILSLDLVKNRVGIMNQEMRKMFIGTILVGLIEKSADAKVMKAITRMVEDWVKTKTTISMNQTPHLKEKVILLVKLMQNVEKRFNSNDDSHVELNAQFLELVNYIYREKELANTDLTSKLEVAFLSGLRCTQPVIRQKFFEVFENSIKRRLFDRLMYICSSQNWESMANHFWIKQCLELVLTVAVNGTQIQGAAPSYQLAPVSSVVTLADSHERAAFVQVTKMKEEPMDIETIDNEEEEIDIEFTDDTDTFGKMQETDSKTPKLTIQQLLARQSKFLEMCQGTKTVSLLTAVCQLAHINSDLATHTWIELFPRIWKVLLEKQQLNLAAELIPFLCSGSHVGQKDTQPSSCKVFFEAITRCVPSLPIRPSVIKYLGKSHNLWHRAALLLELLAMDSSHSNILQLKQQKFSGTEFDFEPNTPNEALTQETYDMLSDIYALLREKDMLTGLWSKKAKYPETVTALSYEQHGYYEQAQTTYEQVMAKARGELNVTAAGSNVLCEFKVWEDHWVQCAKELNQWDLLLEYANSKGNTNPHLILESAWRVPNWSMMKDALAQVEASCPKESAWKVSMYRGYIAICHPDEQHLTMVDTLVDLATTMAIKEWRRLPRVVSHIHTPFLQAAQQIMELQEAAQISKGLQPNTGNRNNSNLHDMKAIVKTWRNRLPILSDDLSHWSDIFAWRQHHYQFIINHYDAQNQSSNSMLGVHASAQAMIHYGKIARKHNLTGVCLDSLSRIHTIPSVPILDCYQKIKQQVKCHLLMAGGMGRNELQEGLEVIESTNLKYFTKEMTAEFYALKGMFLSQIGRSEDANKAFSAAVQMHDTLVKAWALWGDYLAQIFTKQRVISNGVSAIICFLHACRHQNESKSRKYLAKVLWLLTYDDEKLSLADTVDKYCVGVPPMQWLPWIPQLLTCLVQNEGKLLCNLLGQIGRVYPQAVYFPIRTLYLTLKIEQRERVKNGDVTASLNRNVSTEQAPSSTSVSTTTSTTTITPAAVTTTSSTEKPAMTSASPAVTTSSTSATTSVAAIRSALSSTSEPSSSSQSAGLSSSSAGVSASQSESGPIRATPAMWRCSRIMHMQRDLHPTILSSLEGIVDQMVWFRETWYEEVLRQLRQGLTKCYVVAFENRSAVSEATVTPHTLNFVKKLVSTFGIGVENVSAVSQQFSSAASESLARRAQMTAQDPVFQKMKQQFTKDFDFKISGATKLHNLIVLLKKWIKLLEAKTKLLPKITLIEEKCRFLSNFSLQTAEVELPGEFLLPKHSHYYVRIARFMPKVEIVHKLNTACRRLYIRGHNGKVYPYLVVNDANLTEARREERVLQLLRMMNHYLTKQKETSQRLLYFTVPRVVAVAPQMRLVEDNPASTSLLDIFKQRCAKRAIEYDAPITRYYDRLAAVQQRGSQASHQVLRDLLKDIMTNQVPRTILKEWAMHTFQDATDYWTFRANFTSQLALEGLAEYVLHLTRLNPDMMYIHKDSGYISVSYFKFDIDDQSGEFDANRPVPFRLTPNIAEFISQTGVTGPLTAAIVSAARCFVQPQFKLGSILKAILRDEFITWHKKKHDEASPGEPPTDMAGDRLLQLVNKAVLAITTRLQELATFDGAVSRVGKLVPLAHNFDNLCRMDPSWHPWL